MYNEFPLHHLTNEQINLLKLMINQEECRREIQHFNNSLIAIDTGIKEEEFTPEVHGQAVFDIMKIEPNNE